jgi:uncharacterized surface protein with fasciclin (FAS1) repeats
LAAGSDHAPRENIVALVAEPRGMRCRKGCIDVLGCPPQHPMPPIADRGGYFMLRRSLMAALVALPVLAACSTTNADSAASKDIVDTAASAGQFNTLIAAAQAADLVDTLKSPGPLTVFAPTDAAFAALPAGTVENLLKPENKDQLVKVLTYHVVSGKVMAADVVKLSSATTVEGSDVAIDASGGAVKINDAQVVQADVAASNGVIHVIDKVILPPM